MGLLNWRCQDHHRTDWKSLSSREEKFCILGSSSQSSTKPAWRLVWSEFTRVTSAGTWWDPFGSELDSGFCWILGLVLLSHIYPHAALNFHCQHGLCNKECRIHFCSDVEDPQVDIGKICFFGVCFRQTKACELENRTLLTACHVVQAWAPWDSRNFVVISWDFEHLTSTTTSNHLFYRSVLSFWPVLLIDFCELISKKNQRSTHC